MVFNLSNKKVNINVNTPTATRTYTIPDIGAGDTFYISDWSYPITVSLIPSVKATYNIG